MRTRRPANRPQAVVVIAVGSGTGALVVRKRSRDASIAAGVGELNITGKKRSVAVPFNSDRSLFGGGATQRKKSTLPGALRNFRPRDPQFLFPQTVSPEFTL